MSAVGIKSSKSRIAHAVRGLKFCSNNGLVGICLSHRSRGAWIEISCLPPNGVTKLSHRSRGAWIEIVRVSVSGINSVGRIAHAVRGLKFTSGLSASRIYPGRIAHAVY